MNKTYLFSCKTNCQRETIIRFLAMSEVAPAPSSVELLTKEEVVDRENFIKEIEKEKSNQILPASKEPLSTSLGEYINPSGKKVVRHKSFFGFRSGTLKNSSAKSLKKSSQSNDSSSVSSSSSSSSSSTPASSSLPPVALLSSHSLDSISYKSRRNTISSEQDSPKEQHTARKSSFGVDSNSVSAFQLQSIGTGFCDYEGILQDILLNKDLALLFQEFLKQHFSEEVIRLFYTKF